MSAFTCPKCGKNQYAVCGNPDCKCYKIPNGEKPQKWVYRIGYVKIPKSLFYWIWNLLKEPSSIGLNEIIECAYCGHGGSLDYWEEISMEQLSEE
jgi:hypothetical protein